MITVVRDSESGRVETRTFPNGYSVRVVRKEEIMECLRHNVTDPDVVLDIIKHCEISAANFIEQGQWSSIPYMGSLKFSLSKLNTRKKLKELQEGAEGLLDENDPQERARYYLFKKNIAYTEVMRQKQSVYYNYIVALGVKKHRVSYDRAYKHFGKLIARLWIYFLMNITAIDNRYEYEYAEALDRYEHGK